MLEYAGDDINLDDVEFEVVPSIFKIEEEDDTLPFTTLKFKYREYKLTLGLWAEITDDVRLTHHRDVNLACQKKLPMKWPMCTREKTISTPNIKYDWSKQGDLESDTSSEDLPDYGDFQWGDYSDSSGESGEESLEDLTRPSLIDPDKVNSL